MSALVVPADDASIARAAGVLREGGLVAFPTETVYGLGAHARDERAVARVFEAKGRPRFDPLIVHVPDAAHVSNLVTAFPERAQTLADAFWPGPLTLVLPKQANVPDLVTAGADTVAVRVPDHPVAQALLRAADVPVAAPSANPFGRISPTTAQHVAEQLGDRLDLILDGGPCRVGIESTVVQIEGDEAWLLRPGGTTLEQIEARIGPVRTGDTATSRGLRSPGTSRQHYAPATPLVLVDVVARIAQALPDAPQPIGLLTFRPVSDTAPFARIEVLSERGDLAEATATFFAALRRLDAACLGSIVIPMFPETGLGRALNDRLRRAAALELESQPDRA